MSLVVTFISDSNEHRKTLKKTHKISKLQFSEFFNAQSDLVGVQFHLSQNYRQRAENSQNIEGKIYFKPIR